MHWGISVASQTRNVDGLHECSSLTWCNIDVRFTPWCCFEPETSEAISSQVKLDCSIIQSTQRNRYKTRYVLPAIMGPSPKSRGSCIPRLPEKYLPPLGVVDCSSVGKKTTWVATSNHGLDLEVISRHLLTMSSHWKTRELNIAIHHKQEGAVWCHTTNGCTAEIPATCVKRHIFDLFTRCSPKAPLARHWSMPKSLYQTWKNGRGSRWLEMFSHKLHVVRHSQTSVQHLLHQNNLQRCKTVYR